MKLHPESLLARFTANFPREGRLEWIGIRPVKRSDMLAVQTARAHAAAGLDGDHGARRSGGRRQVTLIQSEHLRVMAQLLDRSFIPPELARRNLVVSGVNLWALKDRIFSVGEALLECTGACEPCSRMEENLGSGGYNAMRGHGGITARILRGGVITVGDCVRCLRDEIPTDG